MSRSRLLITGTKIMSLLQQFLLASIGVDLITSLISDDSGCDHSPKVNHNTFHTVLESLM